MAVRWKEVVTEPARNVAALETRCEMQTMQRLGAITPASAVQFSTQANRKLSPKSKTITFDFKRGNFSESRWGLFIRRMTRSIKKIKTLQGFIQSILY